MTNETKQSVEEMVLEIQSLTTAELVSKHVELVGKPPRVKHRAHLIRKLAWELQTRAYGGLSIAAKRRLAELQEDLRLPEPKRTVRAPASSRSGDVPVGTRLERRWRDRDLVVTRVAGGWEIDDIVHRSLSAAAKAVTGSHRNGRAFFGLTVGGRR